MKSYFRCREPSSCCTDFDISGSPLTLYVTEIKVKNKERLYNEHLILYYPCNTEINGRGDSLRSPRDTLYRLKLALTSPTSGGRSVGTVRLRTTGHAVFLLYNILGEQIRWRDL
jgi:hypothetical protein